MYINSIFLRQADIPYQTLTPQFGARAYGSFIYYINAHLPHAREFSAYVREHITRKLSVASGPG